MTSLLGQKTKQGQKFLENGIRIPVTYVLVAGNTVISTRTQEKNKYSAIQMGIGLKKKANKALLGHAKGAGLTSAPIFLKEVRLEVSEAENLPAQGEVLKATEIFKPGDIVDVTGTSKGKGFAGGVKRYGFRGGPKTHGQSDRHRAPGSIGQGTTPGRVYKGKRMAGNMGNDNVTIKNLKIVEVSDDQILIRGLVPGVLGSYMVIKKVGESKKFVPLYREPIAADEIPEEVSKEPEAEASLDVAESQASSDAALDVTNEESASTPAVDDAVVAEEPVVEEIAVEESTPEENKEEGVEENA